jgi:hypothetical protein
VDGGWWSNTPTGIALRSMLHRLGYRFTVNGPKNKSLIRHFKRFDLRLPIVDF